MEGVFGLLEKRSDLGREIKTKILSSRVAVREVIFTVPHWILSYLDYLLISRALVILNSMPVRNRARRKEKIKRRGNRQTIKLQITAKEK